MNYCVNPHCRLFFPFIQPTPHRTYTLQVREQLASPGGGAGCSFPAPHHAPQSGRTNLASFLPPQDFISTSNVFVFTLLYESDVKNNTWPQISFWTQTFPFP